MTVATTRRARALGLLLAAFAAACGSSGQNYSLPVGSDDGGGGSFAGDDASGAGALDASIEENHVTVTIVTLSCAGDCANVEAVATGGHPPYAFAWEDGSTNPSRQICPTSNTAYSVKVTDTGTTGENPRPPASVRVPLAANVLTCPDGGISDASADGPSDCETLLTVVAGSGMVSGDGGVSCLTEAGVPVLAAPVSIKTGEVYEVQENVTVTIIGPFTPPAWDFYGSSSVCSLPPNGQVLGSLTQDPSMPFESFCFRADDDYAALDWTYTSVAAGLGQTTYRICRGCSHAL
jgi:hypothetical protein